MFCMAACHSSCVGGCQVKGAGKCDATCAADKKLDGSFTCAGEYSHNKSERSLINLDYKNLSRKIWKKGSVG